jgi:hypothetical protein
MWRVWVDMLMNVVNKHAPIRETRIGKKRSPRITPNILQQMLSRDYFRKKSLKPLKTFLVGIYIIKLGAK